MGRKKKDLSPWTTLQLLRSEWRGASVATLAKKYGVSARTIYRLRAQYGHEAKMGFLDHTEKDIDTLHELVLGLNETLKATNERCESLMRRVGAKSPPPPPKVPIAQPA